MQMKIDHLLWATSDLTTGMQCLKDVSGVSPVLGGAHPGFGTRNALMSLNDTYLEVIAPDPEQSLTGNLGERFAALEAPYLFSFAISCDDIHAAAKAARDAGLDAGDVLAMSRTRPDGVRLDWSILRLEHPDWDGRFPFLIDWQGSPHPSASTPRGAQLNSFEVLSPKPDALRAIYDRMGLGISVVGGSAVGYAARLGTPKGDVLLLG